MPKELKISGNLNVFAKPAGSGKTMLASGIKDALLIDLPHPGLKIRSFQKWRDWLLQYIRGSCERLGYEIGVGELDEEVSGFVERLITVKPGLSCVVIDGWCGPLLVAHAGDYLAEAKQFYKLVFR